MAVLNQSEICQKQVTLLNITTIHRCGSFTCLFIPSTLIYSFHPFYYPCFLQSRKQLPERKTPQGSQERRGEEQKQKPGADRSQKQETEDSSDNSSEDKAGTLKCKKCYDCAKKNKGTMNNVRLCVCPFSFSLTHPLGRQ